MRLPYKKKKTKNLAMKYLRECINYVEHLCIVTIFTLFTVVKKQSGVECPGKIFISLHCLSQEHPEK